MGGGCGSQASLTLQTCPRSSKPSWADQVEEEVEDGEYAWSPRVTAASPSPSPAAAACSGPGPPPRPRHRRRTPRFPSQPASARAVLIGARLSPVRDGPWPAPLPPMPPPKPSQPPLCSAEDVVTVCLLRRACAQLPRWPAPAFMPRMPCVCSCSRLLGPARVSPHGCPRALPGQSSGLGPTFFSSWLGHHPKGPFFSLGTPSPPLHPSPLAPSHRQMCHQRAPQGDPFGHWGHQPRA